jgi:hypothetical protein
MSADDTRVSSFSFLTCVTITWKDNFLHVISPYKNLTFSPSPQTFSPGLGSYPGCGCGSYALGVMGHSGMWGVGVVREMRQELESQRGRWRDSGTRLLASLSLGGGLRERRGAGLRERRGAGLRERLRLLNHG